MSSAGASGRALIAGLPPATEAVFRLFATLPALAPFVLIGGTAMALQCQHRLSEDLDLWLPRGTLTDAAIRPALDAAQARGLAWQFATPQDQISRVRIQTGRLLGDFVRDYAVGGVKVQFFAPPDGANDCFLPYLEAKATPLAGVDGNMPLAFRIMPLDGLFAMKSHLVTKRHRMRDVFDLWTFVNMGRSVAQIVEAARVASATASAEHIIAVLRGDAAPDAQDEGFEALAAGVSVEAIHADFRTWTDAYERDLARAIKAGERM